ncbi:Integrase catalytic domain-containing protein [Citrus sinensis]|uniref:Integrase catalytic domain-containing protein n=1 Tax=Citrus sinensis TaxID=2711 RepID=A0ACB8KBU0_CITSI|nr:Integrase catalytic domain-containing protein [Citrus sinensis]
MVDAIVSSLMEQLISVAADEVKQQVRLVTGVRQEVKQLTSNLQAIRAVLEDAEQRQMQLDQAVTFWLEQLKDASYDMEDVLDEWVFARLKLQIEGVDDDNGLSLAPRKKKVRSFFRAVSNCFGSFKQLSLRHDIAVKIRGINEKLDDIASQKDRLRIVDEKNELLSKLLCESSEQQKGLHVISLIGLGGIDTFEEIRVAKAIIEGLDDVWDGDYNKWEPFFPCLKHGLHGSKILVTTRNDSVARMMGSTNIIFIEQLTEEECWSLFKRLAFFGRSFEDCERLEPIGRKIARKCKGMPLAAKVIGNLLRSKSTIKDWQRILDSEMWKVKEIGKGLLTPLLLSYNDLSSNSMVKRCFSYCAVFPKDYNMYKEELISLWMAQGYLNAEEYEEMEIIGEECFNILAARSFFQEFEKNDDDDIMRCKMHDIVHDFAQFLVMELQQSCCYFGLASEFLLLLLSSRSRLLSAIYCAHTRETSERERCTALMPLIFRTVNFQWAEVT